MPTRSHKGLDLTQDVRRQEHRLPGGARLGHAAAERLFHKRVEPAGGLVEHEQVRARHQGGDEQYLLLVALGVSPHFLGRVKIETLDQLVAVRGVDPALDPPQEMNRLEPGERGPQAGLAGDVSEPPVCLDGLALAVEPEDLRPPRRRPGQRSTPGRGRVARNASPRSSPAAAFTAGSSSTGPTWRTGSPRRPGAGRGPGAVRPPGPAAAAARLPARQKLLDLGRHPAPPAGGACTACTSCCSTQARLPASQCTGCAGTSSGRSSRFRPAPRRRSPRRSTGG
jgi:hypothetical protein